MGGASPRALKQRKGEPGRGFTPAQPQPAPKKAVGLPRGGAFFEGFWKELEKLYHGVAASVRGGGGSSCLLCFWAFKAQGIEGLEVVEAQERKSEPTPLRQSKACGHTVRVPSLPLMPMQIRRKMLCSANTRKDIGKRARARARARIS